MIDNQFDILFRQKINGEIGIEKFKIKTLELNKSNQVIEEEISKHSSEIEKTKIFGDKYKYFLIKLNRLDNETNRIVIIKTLIYKVIVNKEKKRKSFCIKYKI